MLSLLEFLFAPFRDRLCGSYFSKRDKAHEKLKQMSTAAISRMSGKIRVKLAILRFLKVWTFLCPRDLRALVRSLILFGCEGRQSLNDRVQSFRCHWIIKAFTILLSRDLFLWARLRVLHIFVEPIHHFPQYMLGRFLRGVTMSFERQHHQTRRSAQPADGSK